MTPFHVQCQTCQAFLRVTKPEAIGLILGCPKCNGMVEVQPPADWQDAQNTAAAHTAAAGIGGHHPAELPPVLREPAPGSRWLVPGIAAGALVCTGLLSWVVWSQLREPDRAEPVPALAHKAPATTEETSPVVDETINPAAPTVAEKPPITEPAAPAPQPLKIEPPAVVVNPQPPQPMATVEPAAVTPQNAVQPPREPAPPKPKLVLTPDQPPPPADHEMAKRARGPAADPAGATQASPPQEPEEQPAFNKGNDVAPQGPARVVPPQPNAAPLPRTPLTAVNPKHLELTLASLSYNNVPLSSFLREMSDLAHAEIGIDDETLQRSGLRLTSPIRVQLENVTIRGALQAALRPLELDLIVKENYLWVGHATTAEATHLTRYPIDDLVNKDSADAEAAALAEQVQRMVAPDQWGAAKLDIVPGALQVTQSAAVHDELIVWFEKLRTARGLPLRTKYDPANAQLRRFAPQRFALASRWQLAEPLLGKSVTASFLQPDELGEILDVLRRQSQAVLIWDLPALDAAGLSPDTLATLVVLDARFETALDQLLTPLGLTAIPVDETSLLLTTKTAAAQRQLTERYSLGQLAEQRRWGDDETAITAGLRQEITARGIEFPETLPLAWDRASRTVAINASPLLHRTLGKILAELQQKPVAAATVMKK